MLYECYNYHYKYRFYSLCIGGEYLYGGVAVRAGRRLPALHALLHQLGRLLQSPARPEAAEARFLPSFQILLRAPGKDQKESIDH